MIEFFGSTVLFFIFLFLYFNLSARIRRCEQVLNQIQNSGQHSGVELGQNVLLKQKEAQTSPQPFTGEKLKAPTKSSVTAKPAVQFLKRKPLKKPFKIPNVIKENWMGLFGSVALVIGAVFFGLTAEIMQHAAVRVSVMMGVSLVFLGISLKLKRYPDWTPLSSWLNSIAGAVILFAALGAGGIDGLQCIQSPLYAFCFLCFGVSINMILALLTQSQGVASFHVILSLLAFCIAPQAFILLPIAALVTSTGLIASYRSKWDLHLLLIVIAFACQNTYWTFSLGSQLLPWMHDLAIACSISVSLIAACVHYSKKYQSPKLELLPLIAHISNWGLFIWNIWLHAEFFKGTPLVLGVVAAAGFALSRVAKKRAIYWLYYTDTLLSQLVAMAAIASMSILSINPLDLGIMIFAETLVFNFVCRHQKEAFLLRVGLILQIICLLVIAHDTFEALSITPHADQFPIYLRMGGIAALCWISHVIVSRKKLFIDDIRFVLFGQEDQKFSVSVTSLIGTLFFMGIYFCGFNSLLIQAVTLIMIALIAVWRYLKEDFTYDLMFIMSFALIHLMSWYHLAFLLQQTTTPLFFSRVDFFGVIFLDVSLIFGNFLRFKQIKKNAHNFAIYALGIQIGLLTYVLTSEVSLLIPGLAFLGFSILSLEIGRTVPKWFRYCSDVKLKIKEGMTHIGLAFLMAFIIRFVTVHLQIDPIWHGISIRWATEAMGLLAIVYWMASYPQEEVLSKFTQFCGHRLVEGCLGFITLCVITEVPEVWRPSCWAVLAICLLIARLKGKGHRRLVVYSWIYLIVSIVHVAFVTSNLTMPSLFLMEQYHVPAAIAIILQFVFVYIAYVFSGNLIKEGNHSPEKGISAAIPILFLQPSLTILLPVFLGIALLFAFNFERTILTLLWVGLTCVYLGAGLLVKSKRSIQIAMAALVFCSIRLIIFDLVQSDIATRALVFIGVGCLMLGVSVLYKKYKYRIEVHEAV